jgi:hypothetical protein
MASSFLKTGGIVGGGDVGQYQLYDDLQARLEADTVGMAFSVSPSCSCAHVVWWPCVPRWVVDLQAATGPMLRHKVVAVSGNPPFFFTLFVLSPAPFFLESSFLNQTTEMSGLFE